MADEKISPSDLQKEAERLVKEGKMPDIKTVLTAVAKARKKYAPQIERARRERQ
jgi:hypothetical protein